MGEPTMEAGPYKPSTRGDAMTLVVVLVAVLVLSMVVGLSVKFP